MRNNKLLLIIKHSDTCNRILFYDAAVTFANAVRNDDIVINDVVCKISNVIWNPSDIYLTKQQNVDLNDRAFRECILSNGHIVKAFILHPILV